MKGTLLSSSNGVRAMMRKNSAGSDMKQEEVQPGETGSPAAPGWPQINPTKISPKQGSARLRTSIMAGMLQDRAWGACFAPSIRRNPGLFDQA